MKTYSILFIIVSIILTIITTTTIVVSAKSITEDQYQYLFIKWVNHHNKQYETNDLFARFNNFKSQLDFVIQHNASESTWTAGLNQFSDLSDDEYRTILGLNTNLRTKTDDVDEDLFHDDDNSSSSSSSSTASYISWESNFPKIKDQRQCGSCYAFAAVSLVEAMYNHQFHQSRTFSEQQIVDCDTTENGCNGGLPRLALAYIQKNGLCLESDYPYRGNKGNCVGSCTKLARVIDIATVIDQNTSTNLINHKTALQKAPINIGIDAANAAFRNYQAGVIQHKDCKDTQLNHSVVIVGYDKDSKTGVEFFKIRNHWGGSWGESGYIRLAAERGVCGLGYGTDSRQAIKVAKM